MSFLSRKKSRKKNAGTPVQERKKEIKIGSRVQLVGLSNHAHLNYTWGEVIEIDLNAEIYALKMDNRSDNIGAKIENMRTVAEVSLKEKPAPGTRVQFIGLETDGELNSKWGNVVKGGGKKSCAVELDEGDLVSVDFRKLRLAPKSQVQIDAKGHVRKASTDSDMRDRMSSLAKKDSFANPLAAALAAQGESKS